MFLIFVYVQALLKQKLLDAVKMWWYLMTTNFANCSQNVPVEKFRKLVNILAKIWTKVCCLLFGGHPVYCRGTA